MKNFIRACDSLISGLGEHPLNVANACIKIFNSLSSTEKKRLLPFHSERYSDTEIVFFCGLYHDIGKSHMQKNYPLLLDKKTFKQSDKELMKQHTIMGAQILLSLSYECDVDSVLLAYLIQVAVTHHEKLNGKGYFLFQDIPLISQMIAVADIYSAGIEKRVYEGEKSVERLKQEMYSMSINQTYVDALFSER